MRSTVIDEDGNVTCPKCGQKNNFTSKRSGKAKILGAATIGIGAVAAPKRLQCHGCGTYLKTGGFAARTAAPRRAKPAPAVLTSVDVGDRFTVELQVVGNKKIQVIKALREVRRLGLREAKELVDRADRYPTVLAQLPESEANAFAARLKQAGAVAVVTPPRQQKATSLSAAPAPTVDIPAQIAKLAELHSAGVLTESEFTAKKTELLGRM